jgi:hypothetical protein
VVGAAVGAGEVALVSDGVGVAAGQEGVLSGRVRVGLDGALGAVVPELCGVADGLGCRVTPGVGLPCCEGTAAASGLGSSS